MMFAGAFGNAIDRIFRGFVIDYIQTSFINFPVFNIADIGITVGEMCIRDSDRCTRFVLDFMSIRL